MINLNTNTKFKCVLYILGNLQFLQTVAELCADLHYYFAEEGSGNPRYSSERNQFWKARCSVRIWPIKGHTEDELWTQVKKFMTGALEMTESEYDGLSILNVRRVRSAPAARVHNEILITMAEPEQRDFVFSRGNRLSQFVKDGKPTAGIRMDVPADLVDTHKLLNDLGYQIKRKFGPNTRKYVKFDSEQETLFLEVRLPDSFNWLRITPEMARGMKQKYDEKELHRLNSISPAARLSAPLSAEQQQRPGRNPRMNGSGGMPHSSWRPSSFDEYA